MPLRVFVFTSNAPIHISNVRFVRIELDFVNKFIEKVPLIYTQSSINTRTGARWTRCFIFSITYKESSTLKNNTFDICMGALEAKKYPQRHNLEHLKN